MSEEKETKNVVEENVDKVVDTVKDATDKVVEASKETVETVKEVVTEVKEVVVAPATTKKATWWNRIWSAIVGAVIAVASMFGINTAQLNEQKAEAAKVKTDITTAIDSIKKGDVAGGLATLEKTITEVKETAKEAVKEVKEVAEAVKNTDKTEIAKTAVKGAADALMKDNVKKAEITANAYKN